MQGFYDGVSNFLGLRVEPRDLTFVQISVRGIIVFLVTLVMLRLASRRFLAKLSALDAILGFILASMLARAVNGSSAFFPTLGAGFIVVGLHRLLTRLTVYSDPLGKLIKGTEDTVIKEGKLFDEALKANDMSRRDLMEELRLNGRINDPADADLAIIERNGQISVVPKE